MRRHAIQFLCLAGVLMAWPETTIAQVRDNPGFRTKSIARNDDGSAASEPLGWTLNFFGVRQTNVYVNNNGNVTFDSPLPTYTPFGLTGVHRQIIAPFFADVDTRSKFSNLVTYGSDTVNGHKAFGANWLEVGYYNQHDDKTNSFQLVLIEREDTGNGNFDIEFNYSHIKWETGDASDGVNGFGGVPASAGWSNGTGIAGTSYELPGSLIPGAFLDSGPYALARGRTPGATNITGRWVYRARGGTITPALTITTGCPVPNGSASKSYTFRFEAVGSKPPYRWALTPDPDTTLPLTLNGTSGQLSGVVGAPGVYGFTVRLSATDEDGDVTVSRRCSITVDPANISILSDSTLPGGTAGVNYSTRLRADGGTGPFRFDLVNSTVAPGLSLNPNGTLSGMPTADGNFAMQVMARSEGTDQAVPSVKRFTIRVQPSALSVRGGSCPLPNGTGNVPFTHQFEAAGGSPPYRWSVAGTLPTGLYMGAEGRISGIPTVPHWWPFTVKVQDARGNSAEFGCGVVILFPEVEISGACPLPNARAGETYTRRLTAVGGSGAVTWSVVSGHLPPGLRMSEEGVVSGTPLNSGPNQFRLRAQDGRGQAASTACSLTVNAGTFGITSCPLPDGFAGDTYSQQLNATGGNGPYIFNSSGNLPAGIRLTPAGVLTAAVGAGSYPLSLTVTDAGGRTASKSCSLNVRPQALRLTTECPLPDGIIGRGYNFAITAAGGVEPFSFTALTPLPPGLRFGENGALAGTPTAAGYFPIAVSVKDRSNQVTQQACGISVDLPPLPDVKITGVPATLAPTATGPRFTVDLAAVYPLAIDGEVTLSVAADTGNAVGSVDRADPALRLTGGPFRIPFSIKAGDRSATFQIAAAGTVASTVTISAGNLQAAGVPFAKQATAVMKVPRQAPVLTNVCYSPTPEGFTVDISGYSTTRDVTNADLTFGSNTFVVDLTASSQDYFANDDSVRTGGTFRITAPYRLTNRTAQALGQGNAVVKNSAGAAASRSIARCN